VNVVNAAGTAVVIGSRMPFPPRRAGKCMMGIACVGKVECLVIVTSVLWIIIWS
jgi:hypothetical protein